MAVRGQARAAKSYVAGASAALNKSRRELDDFLNGLDVGPTRSSLREEYRTLLLEFAERWFHVGFNRGCIESKRAFDRTVRFPRSVTYDAHRDFFRTGVKRRIKITWPSK